MLNRRLAWSGLSRTLLEEALAPHVAPGDPDLPSWALVLRDMVSGVRTSREGARAGEAVPFQDALIPFVEWATGRWQTERPETREVFGGTAISDAQAFLLTRLSERSGLALLREFGSFDGPEAAIAGGLPASDESRYQAFTQHLLRGGWMEVFTRYPVLARQVGCAVGSWIDSMVELSSRLLADTEALRATFGVERDAYPVQGIDMGAGDPHQGGRATAILTLQGGTRIVYKPRDLGAEATWFRILAWIDGSGSQARFQVVEVLERSGYGWMEFVEHRQVANPDEARRYYETAGQLVCLIYVLGGLDYHYENLVSGGIDPVLVDLETVVHPRRAAQEAALRSEGPDRPLRHRSVLRGGLLPRWDTPHAGTPVDLSALGCQSRQEMRYPTLVWRDVNSDRMAVKEAPTPVEPAQNQPHPNGPEMVFSQFEDDLVDGFESMYRWILANRETWLDARGPAHWFKGCPIRYLARASIIYKQALDRGRDPGLLSDGVAWSVQADAMNGSWLKRDERPSVWGVIPEEHRVLMDGDIPRFGTGAESHDLPPPFGSTLQGCFSSTAGEEFRLGLRSLDEADLADQIDLMRRSIQVWDMVRSGGSELDLYLAASLLPRGGIAP